jgi:ribonuclease Y
VSPTYLFVLADIATGYVVLVAFVAALMGMGVVKLLGYLRKRDAEKEAQQILEKAEIQAGARRKEAEVEAKELALKEKTRIEEQLNDARQKIFERERHLDKQSDVQEQRSDQLQKQEKMVENNQRKLSEKL